jgi:alanyl-tRNA synthetase
MMTGDEIRSAFVRYFEERGHRVIPSAPLVPYEDPTLLFTNAGMVQFKKVFLREETRDYTRAVTVQKCLRAGGKHNDLENVGHTARHHTFFEMLGNFSFGDYFKEGAIQMGWEFLVEYLRLPAEDLWVSIYKDDEDAFSIWHDKVGVPAERIVRMGEKDNFWAMAETGPCGPCSEILIDQGEGLGCGSADCAVGCECDRYLELWNLVFMQYNRDEGGTLHPLPKPCIDTGLGLERIAAVVQGVESNYDSDLFQGILDRVTEVSGVRYGEDEASDISMRVIADHARAVTFLLADGVLPSNEGRGYVLRRIIRRALRHGKLLGIREPFMVAIRERVVHVMAAAYPELAEGSHYLSEILHREEERFSETLDNGLKVVREELERLKNRGEHVLNGEVVFKLYDTFGFPVDLTEDIVSEEGFRIDLAGFERAMDGQKQRARESRKGELAQLPPAYRQMMEEGMSTEFVGYDTLDITSDIVRIIKDGENVSAAHPGETVEIVTTSTPFYGESGGQVGDTGTISTDGFMLEVDDCRRPTGELIVHRGTVVRGDIELGETVHLEVNEDRRNATARNHTATHLLQSALREILGAHVNQAGSLVAPERFRFDFTHFAAIDEETLRDIETRVNQRIWEGERVLVEIMDTEEAIGRGATALFGEKYGEEARVISIADYSKELCGGTHIHHTNQIGLFKVVTESGVAAGVRRIEGVTGWAALNSFREEERQLKTVWELVKARPKEVVPKITKFLERQRSLERELENLRKKLTSGQAVGGPESRDIHGIKVVGYRAEEGSPKALREIGDGIKDKIGSGIVAVGGEQDGKATVVLMVTRDLATRCPASELINDVARVIDGKGGGNPTLAQAGGKDGGRLGEALEAIYRVVEERAAPT